MSCAKGCCETQGEHYRSLIIDGRFTPKAVREGRNADTGERWKATTDELNNTVTERSKRGPSGVSERQDVHLRPDTVRARFGAN